jgi:hypothetical protein
MHRNYHKQKQRQIILVRLNHVNSSQFWVGVPYKIFKLVFNIEHIFNLTQGKMKMPKLLEATAWGIISTLRKVRFDG